jgi:hypothetical protein
VTVTDEQVRRRRAASARLRYIGTDCYDIADDLLGTGPRPGQAEQLEQAAADLAAVARELSKLEREQSRIEPKEECNHEPDHP